MKLACSLLFLSLILPRSLAAQDWLRSGSNRSTPVRLAAADFKAAGPDPRTAPLNTVFNQTLWNDLDTSGVFEMVSKSFYPLQTPGTPSEIRLDTWSHPPPSAPMVVFGNLGVANGKVAVQGWLFDTKNTNSPVILEKQFREDATPENARLIAHRLANAIVYRLGGGIPDVAETRIYFISSRTGNKEVWSMDYDGAGQQQLTHLNSTALSPHVSPDGSRVAFSARVEPGEGSWQIMMYSLDQHQILSFPRFGGDNLTPAWSSDGSKLAFSSSKSNGDAEIFVTDSAGGGGKRLTAFKGADLAPAWNPKTNAQIAWVSERTGLPQIFIMDADGGNVQQITSEGYAGSPSWSPNGLLLAFSGIRNYHRDAPGNPDIYLMDIASRQFVQLTHDAGANDFPCWSPDSRHIVFQSNRSGSNQVWTMLADGTRQQQLTRQGENSQPTWSYKCASGAPVRSVGAVEHGS